MIGWLVVFAVGVFVGVGWSESEVVRERVRQAWRRGYRAGKIGTRMAASPWDEREWARAKALEMQSDYRLEAVERLIRDTGGRSGSSDAF